MNILNKIKTIVAGRKKSFGVSEIYQSKELKDSDGLWGTTSFLQANEISLYTNRAIAKRAEKVGETKFIIRNSQGEETENEDLIKLLQKPNPEQSGFEFFELYQKYKDLTGSTYVLLSGDVEGIGIPTKITSMWILPSGSVTEKYDKEGVLLGYDYKTASSSKFYELERIIASKYLSPKNPRKGVSLLQAGAYAIDTETQLSQNQANLLRNGGKIDGVFSFEANLTQSQLAEVKKDYEDKYANAKKTGMPLFIGGSAKYERVGSTPEELSYIESKKMTLNDICIMTGVPKVLLAMFDDMKYDNADGANKMFLKETIKPLIDNLIFKLNQNSYITQNNKFYIDYENPVPEDIELILKKNDNGIKNYYLTPNEARESLGYDPIQGGESLMTPLNIMPGGNIPKEEEKLKKKQLK